MEVYPPLDQTLRGDGAYVVLTVTGAAPPLVPGVECLANVFRGRKCPTKTGVLSLSSFSQPLRWHRINPKRTCTGGDKGPSPPVLKFMDSPGHFPVSSASNLIAASETQWPRGLAQSSLPREFNSHGCSGVVFPFCLFFTFSPWQPGKPEKELLVSFLYLVQWLSHTTWSPFHNTCLS